MSGDCSLSTDDNPPVTIMDESSLCDTRLEDCQFATIYGRNFPITGLECDVTSASVRNNPTLLSDIVLKYFIASLFGLCLALIRYTDCNKLL